MIELQESIAGAAGYSMLSRGKDGNMGKSRASKQNGYRAAVSRQRNDVYKFRRKKGKKKQ